MNEEITVSDFSPHLFWDVDLEDFQLNDYPAFMIGRVLEYGKLEDWKLLKKLYGLEKIKKYSLEIRSLNPISLSFLSSILDIDEKKFRCYKHRQLVQNYWNS